MIKNTLGIDYNKYVENTFLNRFINPVYLQDFLIDQYGLYINKIGYSTLGIPIFKITIGSGKTKILSWTQMHGNESTSTLAFLDLLKMYSNNSEFAKSFNNRYQLDLILMLNPDGSMHWKRENALGIDLNRDFNQAKSPEMNILKNVLFENDYQLALNCHDQRSIFGNKTTNKPATLALLAPAIDDENSINNARSRAIKILANVYLNMNKDEKQYITRFDDAFYPNAAGDNIQKLNIPTILLESGHHPNDYKRKRSREYFFKAILNILNFADLEVLDNDYVYYEIPKNDNDFRDILVRNVNIESNGYISSIDIALQYKEERNEENSEIELVPYIQEIGNLRHLKGWKEYNLAAGKIPYKDNIFNLNGNGNHLLQYLKIDLEIPKI